MRSIQHERRGSTHQYISAHQYTHQYTSVLISAHLSRHVNDAYQYGFALITNTHQRTHQYTHQYTPVHMHSHINTHRFPSVLICSLYSQHVHDAHSYEAVRTINTHQCTHQYTRPYTSVYTSIPISRHQCKSVRFIHSMFMTHIDIHLYTSVAHISTHVNTHQFTLVHTPVHNIINHASMYALSTACS